MSQTEYVPPKIWEWDAESGGRFANINRPIAGATHDKELPIGEHPYQLYSLGTPNGVKVTVMLEELLALGHEGAEYDAWLINIGEGDQFGSGFVDINPNSKIPAMMDRSDKQPVRLFESASMLVHLAEKFDAFLPHAGKPRAETFSWLFWQMAQPLIWAAASAFLRLRAFKMEYPINRFAMEVKRQMDVLDQHLADHEYLAGTDYTIADMATWPWYGALASGLCMIQPSFCRCRRTKPQSLGQTNCRAPCRATRGIVNRPWGDKTALERHSAADIDSVLKAE